jgi:hypothetical protein
MSGLSEIQVPAFRRFPAHLVGQQGPTMWAKARLLQALDRLQIPSDKWPSFRSLNLPSPEMAFYTRPPDFKPPVFDFMRDSPAEWRRQAGARWKDHCDSFLKRCEEEIARMESSGQYVTIPPLRSSGPKRTIPPAEVRFEWAALRLSGLTYPEIARKYSSPRQRFTSETVKMTCRKIFKDAGLNSDGTGTE